MFLDVKQVNLNFFVKPTVNLLSSTQLLTSFSGSLIRHKVTASTSRVSLSWQGRHSHSNCPALVPCPAFTIHSDLQSLKV